MSRRTGTPSRRSGAPNQEISILVPEPARVHAALHAWYLARGRDLPWRHTRDPYAILVSEIMLQQTQVDRVIPKYHAFLAAFPTFAALAAAPPEAVIRAWAPLGYNQRAVRLRDIARAVVTEHAGRLPATVAGLMALPGVGRYTAGALACFALGQAVATVDTNIQRVLGRVFLGQPAPALAAQDAVRLAEAALPATPAAAYDWNQALMDLGATVCVARAPACERCPLTDLCQALARERATMLFPTGAALRATIAAGRVAEAAAPYTTRPKKAATPFKESRRYSRGRVIAALRDQPTGVALDLATLGPLVKAGFAPEDAPWLREIVAGLVRDGLAAWADAARELVILPP